MIELLVATTNKGKIAELAGMLRDLPCQIIGLDSLPNSPPIPEETGATFAENALLKAEHYFNHAGLLTLADDSGLEVDALGGAPGIWSARYAGAGASDAERVARLLEELRDVPDAARTARFRCSIALVGVITGAVERHVFEGSCEGVITRAPRGRQGFGYDPVFLDGETGRTFAELSPAEKSARSHRGRALGVTRSFLERRLKRDDEG
ncbi:MAG TPA: RdgB/HAM1 family non-canonical purine NTP pyrophosphatase [Blastocatellia bacterium]|nr:RdgB/HAM1 family non-canonical purine NTP pyrophosphatase [Blastocatellia bacterium]